MPAPKVMTKKQVQNFLDDLMYRSILDRDNIDDAYKELDSHFKRIPIKVKKKKKVKIMNVHPAQIASGEILDE